MYHAIAVAAAVEAGVDNKNLNGCALVMRTCIPVGTT